MFLTVPFYYVLFKRFLFCGDGIFLIIYCWGILRAWVRLPRLPRDFLRAPFDLESVERCLALSVLFYWWSWRVDGCLVAGCFSSRWYESCTNNLSRSFLMASLFYLVSSFAISSSSIYDYYWFTSMIWRSGCFWGGLQSDWLRDEVALGVVFWEESLLYCQTRLVLFEWGTRVGVDSPSTPRFLAVISLFIASLIILKFSLTWSSSLFRTSVSLFQSESIYALKFSFILRIA